MSKSKAKLKSEKAAQTARSNKRRVPITLPVLRCLRRVEIGGDVFEVAPVRGRAAVEVDDD